VQVKAKALLFDVSLRNMTFFHYVQDVFQESSSVNLYEDVPIDSIVIDAHGNERIVKTYVFSRALKRHRSPNLRQTLIQNKRMNRQKIGNTTLIVLNLQDVVDCAERMVRSGKSLWRVSLLRRACASISDAWAHALPAAWNRRTLASPSTTISNTVDRPCAWASR